MKNILLLGNVLIDRVAISGRRINSERKNMYIFLSSKIALENNSLREEHILLTRFTNTNYRFKEEPEVIVVWSVVFLK